MTVTVLCVGLTTIDLVYQGVDGLIAGAKAQAQSMTLASGGPAANAAIAAADLGAAVTLCSCVGEDQFGDLAREQLTRHGVHLLAANSESIPISTVLIGSDGERSIISANGGGHRPDAPVGLARQAAAADVVLVDGHYPELARCALEAARTAERPTVIDLGSWKPELPSLLPLCDLAIASADFTVPEGEVVSTLFEHGVSFVAISNGGSPLTWHSSNGSSETVTIPDVDVVATNGAGDVLHGAFANFIAHGDGPVEALRKAVMFASASCTHWPARIPSHLLATTDSGDA